MERLDVVGVGKERREPALHALMRADDDILQVAKGAPPVDGRPLDEPDHRGEGGGGIAVRRILGEFERREGAGAEMDARPAEQLGRLLDEGVVAHAHDAVGIRLRDVREEGVDVLIVQKRAVERIRNPLAAGAQSRHERVGGLTAAHGGARPDGGAGAFSPQAQVLG